MNAPLKYQPLAARSDRPLAPSLERLRLRVYLALMVGDIVALVLAFFLAGGIYLREWPSPNAMLQVQLLLPVFLTIATATATTNMATAAALRAAETAGYVIRYLALVLLLAYAAAAWGSGVDRLAGRVPEVAPAVPALFVSDAARSQAAVALQDGRHDEAAIQATRALMTSPLEPTHAGLLGGALLGQGNAEQADKAFRIAGQLGWRDPVSQAYWYEVALATGDLDIAAQRLDALLRVNPALTSTFEVTAPLETTAEGQQALGKRLAEGPDWADGYFSPPRDIPAPQFAGRARILAGLGKAGEVDCAVAGRFALRLIAARQAREAKEIWRAACAQASDELLVNGTFERAGALAASPFDWAEFADGSVSLRRLGSAGGLEAQSTSPIARRLVRQLLVIEPGRYRLSWDARNASGEPSDRIFASAACRIDTPGRLEAGAVGGRFVAEFTVPSGCEAFYLAFSLRPGSGAVALRDVDLTRR